MKKKILISLVIFIVNFQFVHPANIKNPTKYNIYETKNKFEKDLKLNVFYAAYQIYQYIFIDCNLIDRLTLSEKKDIISRILKILNRNNLAEIEFLEYQGKNDLVIKMTNNFRFSTEEDIETNRLIFISNYDKKNNRIISNKGITFNGNEHVYLFYLINEKIIYYLYAPVRLVKTNDFNFIEVQEKADFYLFNENDDDDILAFNILNNELKNKDLDKQKHFVYNYYLILYLIKINSFDKIKEKVNENELLIKDIKDSRNVKENKMLNDFIDIYSSLRKSS